MNDALLSWKMNSELLILRKNVVLIHYLTPLFMVQCSGTLDAQNLIVYVQPGQNPLDDSGIYQIPHTEG